MMDNHQWWQTGVIYQIYPRSFQDSNRDGVGDLAGILRRLPYLKWLGVEAIWLSPIYPSPMADFGYDVADYCNIDPLFGDLASFDRLLDEAHALGLKVILDFVPNHTSDQHPWFIESRSSIDSPKRDWYIWHRGRADGSPPTNWLSSFGGSAWTLDPVTGEFYHHHFLSAQPDLNWRNPEVVQAMLEAMQFWLDKGVDGFRLDVIWLIIKDNEFRDNPANPNFHANEPPHHRLLATYTSDRPEVHTIIAQMRALLDNYPQRMMVGEIYLPIERLMTYYGVEGGGVHLPFNFQLISLPWHARTIAQAIDNYEASLPTNGWPNWVLGNHDQPRLATRIGREQARVAAMLLLTLRGTPTIYYGEEIGMENVFIPPDRIQDPFEKNVPDVGVGRDPQRTPMLWEASPGAGFSESEPWLPITDDFAALTVAEQRHHPQSLLNFYRRLIAYRREHLALNRGDYHVVPAEGDLIAYVRRYDDEAFLVVLNLDDHDQSLSLPWAENWRVGIATGEEHTVRLVDGQIHLAGNCGVVLECHGPATALMSH